MPYANKRAWNNLAASPVTEKSCAGRDEGSMVDGEVSLEASMIHTYMVCMVYAPDCAAVARRTGEPSLTLQSRQSLSNHPFSS